MFITAKLIKNSSEPLLYKIPENLEGKILTGSIIKVPLRNKVCLAIVENVFEKLPENIHFNIRKIISIEQFPQDKTYNLFMNELSRYYQIDASYFIGRLQNFLNESKKIDDNQIYQENGHRHYNKVTLTEEQQKVYDFLSQKITSSVYTPTLLHGVTGSGKTEVYKKLIEHTIAQNKTILFLCPEVTLALQFENIFKQENWNTLSFHSNSTITQKRNLWNFLLQKKGCLIIGVHLPVLLPIYNLGLIIIDEEHDIGYQEKKHPKINTKEAALIKAKLANVPILLGSATPSISSLNNINKLNWNFFQIKKRFAGNFPEIKIIKLLNKISRKNFWISKELEETIKDRLIKKEQVIIFINRRGFSFFVQCKNCAFIFQCKDCSVSLTPHANELLYCHYCGASNKFPKICNECKTTEFLKKGIGTEQIVSILEKLFPYAKIGRADLDITSKKTKWQETLQNFKENKIDILVGTQTITKGYHFPKVTLVGIIWADLNLNFPIYNASETTLQQLIQVAGRAGRSSTNSTVIVQTMTEHNIFEYLNEIDYLKFFNYEIENRQMIEYPPFIRFIEIELKNNKEQKLNEEAEILANELIKNNKNELKIFGPIKPLVSKIKKLHMRKIYIKAKNINDVINLFGLIKKDKFKSQIFFVPNPLN